MENSVSPRPVSAAGVEPLSCIIIDDEPIALRGMALMAVRHPALSLKAMFSEPLEALEWMESHSVDLVFLDIEMPGMKGLDLASRLSDDTLVIFTTAYSEYAARSYDLDAVDYLLKPIDAARFDRAIQKSLQRMSVRYHKSLAGTSPTLTLRADRRFVNIDPGTIIFIEGMKDYIRIHTDSEHIISRITIKSLLERLPAGPFVRIHKSYVINTSRVRAYDNSNIILHSNAPGSKPVVLPVGTSFRSDLLKIISNRNCNISNDPNQL